MQLNFTEYTQLKCIIELENFFYKHRKRIR